MLVAGDTVDLRQRPLPNRRVTSSHREDHSQHLDVGLGPLWDSQGPRLAVRAGWQDRDRLG